MSTNQDKKAKMGDRWAHIDKLLSRTGPLAVDGFEEAVGMIRPFLQDSVRILVIGAGGLGCELLKDLALMGFRNLEVIDMDTIDLSNLNRQFLFREADIGKPKAEVAAKFIERRVPGCKVVPHFCRIEDKDRSFYKQFTVVVCGLDSIVARRWINSMMHSLLRYNDSGDLDQTSMIPLIDGGTEGSCRSTTWGLVPLTTGGLVAAKLTHACMHACKHACLDTLRPNFLLVVVVVIVVRYIGFQGNARVVFPGMTACVECMLSLYTPQVNFPMCTIANTPRLPEHCIEYARLVLWPKERDDQIDGDNPEHITWLFEKAKTRAAEFGISGVTYRLTQGVTKRIIPNVASTSAVIAAACANEVFKVVSSCTKYLDNNLIFNDVEGVYTFAYQYDRDPNCLTCSNKPVDVPCSQDMSLTQLRDHLCTSDKLQLRSPGLTATVDGKNKTLYMAKPASLEEATRPNLDKSLKDLGLQHNSIINVVDATVAGALRLRLDMDTVASD